jgi:hypothetical protein
MRKTADEIMMMDDRPLFPVEVPEWGLIGEDAAMVRQPDALTLARVGSEADDSPEGKVRQSVLLIMECCVEPKFQAHHLEKLMREKSATAVSALISGIMAGGKKKEPLSN